MIRYRIILFIALCLLGCSHQKDEKMQYIVTIANTTNLGDVANAKLTAEALKAQGLEAEDIITVNAGDSKAVTAILKKCQEEPNASYVFLGAGDKAWGPLLEIAAQKHTLPSSYFYFSAHQYYPALFDHVTPGLLDHIGLPGSAMTREQEATIAQKVATLTKMFAVPANTDKSMLKEAYDAWDEPGKPMHAQPILMVMLGGDAVDTDNSKQLYFTAEDATQMAKAVEAYAKEHPNLQILVTNGPRTGRGYDPETENMVCDHMHPVGKERSLDAASAAFTQYLEGRHVPFRFWDFYFSKGADGKKKGHSVYYPLFYLVVSNPQSRMLMAGESVSGITETIELLLRDQIMIYPHAAMNQSHHALVKEGYARGFYGILSEEGFRPPKEGVQADKPRDAERVARAIWERLCHTHAPTQCQASRLEGDDAPKKSR